MRGNLYRIGGANAGPATAKCGVTYVCLAISWYGGNQEQDKAKKLVQLLLRSDLTGEEIEITEEEKKLLEESSPFSVL